MYSIFNSQQIRQSSRGLFLESPETFQARKAIFS